MGCQGSKTADGSKPAPHHSDGRAHCGGWKPKSKKYQRAIGNPEAASLVTHLAPADSPAEVAFLAVVHQRNAAEDGCDRSAVATVTPAGVAETSAARRDHEVPHDLIQVPSAKFAASCEEADVLHDATDALADAIEVTVDATSPETSVPLAAEWISEQEDKSATSNALGRCPSASKQFWPLICPGDAALLVEDAVLFGGQGSKDDKLKIEERSMIRLPVFLCTPHCRRSCSAGSEAEINTECGTSIAAY